MDPKLEKQLEDFLLPLIGAEVQRAIPLLEEKLPGAAKELATAIFARPEVKAWMTRVEQEGLEAGMKLLEGLLSQIRQAIADHLAAALHPHIAAGAPTVATADGPLPVLHLTAAQVKAMAALPAGRLDQLLGISS